MSYIFQWGKIEKMVDHTTWLYQLSQKSPKDDENIWKMAPMNPFSNAGPNCVLKTEKYENASIPIEI